MAIIGYNTKGASAGSDVGNKAISLYNTESTIEGKIETLNTYILPNRTCKIAVYDAPTNGNLIYDAGEVTADGAGLASIDISAQNIQVSAGVNYYIAIAVPNSANDSTYFDFNVPGSGGNNYNVADYPNEFVDPFGATSNNSIATITMWAETVEVDLTITITEKNDNFQGVLNSSDQISLDIEGGATTQPASMEARVKRRDTDAVVLDWVALTGQSLSPTAWSGTIPAIPGTNALLYYEVRDSAVPAFIVASVKDFGTAYHFMTGGQSNMDYMFVHGTGTPSPLTYKIDDASGDVKTMTGQGAITLANALQVAFARPIVLYDFGTGSASLIEANDVFGAGWWLTTSGQLASTIYTNLKNAVDNYTGGAVHGFLWHQGETDAVIEESATDYQTNEAAFFAQVRSDFPNAVSGILPIFSCLLNRWLFTTATDQSWIGVNTAKIANYKSDANAYYVNAIDQGMRDDFHLDDAGYGALGTRYGQMIKYVFGLATYYEHPEIASYEVINTTTTEVTITLSSGATDFTPTTNIDSIELLLDAVWTAVDFDRETPTTAQAIHAAGTVTGARCLYGKTPSITNILKDNSALALPVMQNYDIPVYAVPNPQPTVTITSPTTDPTATISVDNFTLAGTSSVSSGSITSVTWSDNRGGSGDCTGTTNWTANITGVVEGDTIYTATTTTDLLETSTDILTITYTIPVNPVPVVTITTPTSDATYATSSGSVALGGISLISSGSVASIGIVNDRGGSYTATGTATWTQSSVTLYEGANVITVTATSDLSETSTDILTITYTPAPGGSLIIIEDGTIVSMANSYSTRAEYIAYALTFGTTIADTTASDVQLISAAEFMESKRANYKGEVVDREQYLSFPRYDVVIEGFYWTSEEIPRQVKLCQMAIALDINSGNDPYNPPIIRTRKSEEIDGAVKVAYFGRDQDVKLSRNSKWSALLSSLLKNSGLGIAMERI